MPCESILALGVVLLTLAILGFLAAVYRALGPGRPSAWNRRRSP